MNTISRQHFVSVDPGAYHAAWALFEAGTLYACGHVRADKSLTDPLAISLDVASQLMSALEDLDRFELPHCLVIERMVSRGENGMHAVDAILAVSMSVGAIGSCFHQVVSRTPGEWKNNAPKEVTDRHVRRELNNAEHAILTMTLKNTPKAHHDDVRDAVAIGLSHAGRILT